MVTLTETMILSPTIRYYPFLFHLNLSGDRCIIGYWILLTVCYRPKWRLFLHIYILQYYNILHFVVYYCLSLSPFYSRPSLSVLKYNPNPVAIHG